MSRASLTPWPPRKDPPSSPNNKVILPGAGSSLDALEGLVDALQRCEQGSEGRRLTLEAIQRATGAAIVYLFSEFDDALVELSGHPPVTSAWCARFAQRLLSEGPVPDG